MSEYIITDEQIAENRRLHGNKLLVMPVIVRCRDCINLEHWKFRDGSERLVCCMVDVFDVFEDGFCAWGERKDEDGR